MNRYRLHEPRPVKEEPFTLYSTLVLSHRFKDGTQMELIGKSINQANKLVWVCHRQWDNTESDYTEEYLRANYEPIQVSDTPSRAFL